MSNFETKSIAAVIASTTIVAFISYGFFIWKEKKKSSNSNFKENVSSIAQLKWRRIGEVEKILIYPLKASKHLALNMATCTKKGLLLENPFGCNLLDRSFIVYDCNNERVTSINHPKILFVGLRAGKGSTVEFSYPGAEDLLITLPSENETSTKSFVMMYSREKISTFDCGDGAAQWFSRNLLNKDLGFRLGYHRNVVSEERTLTGYWTSFTKIYTRMKDDYFGTYAYLSSYLITTRSSVDDLNHRLQEPVSDYQFRPNIVIKGTKPYDEDCWDWIRIGEHVIFRGFKPCTRCIITTIDPETGMKHPGQEPLKTLKKYRQLSDPEEKKLEGNCPVLGLYAGLHNGGKICVGDPVFINI